MAKRYCKVEISRPAGGVCGDGEWGRGQGVVKFTSAALATLLLPPSLPPSSFLLFSSLRKSFYSMIIKITFALINREERRYNGGTKYY